jgi:putative multiple sugar transport system permease protein
VLLSAIIIVFSMLLASYKGVPVVGLILLGLIIIYSFITQKTVFGRHIYAVGGNRNAARLTGVNTKFVDFMVMVNMSMLAGIAGMVYTAYLNAANPKDGTGFELDAIAAVFIGGAAVTGGIGTVVGSMIGGLVMGVLNLGLANMSVDQNLIQVIKGLVLLGAVAFDVLSKMQGKPSIIGMIQRGMRRGDGNVAIDATPVRAELTPQKSGAGGVATNTQDEREGLVNKDD